MDYCTGQRLTGSRDENANTGTGTHYYGMTASDAAKYQAKVRRDFQSEYAGCSGVPALSFQ